MIRAFLLLVLFLFGSLLGCSGSTGAGVGGHSGRGGEEDQSVPIEITVTKYLPAQGGLKKVVWDSESVPAGRRLGVNVRVTGPAGTPVSIRGACVMPGAHGKADYSQPIAPSDGKVGSSLVRLSSRTLLVRGGKSCEMTITAGDQEVTVYAERE